MKDQLNQNSSKDKVAEKEFGDAFAERNPDARELPETKIAIARQAAEVLSGEYVESLPPGELFPLSYKLAVKAMDTMMREAPMGFEAWRVDNPAEAKKLDVAMQVALSMQGKIAIPKTLDPAKYIKETKKDKRWSSIFGKGKKDEELELELHKKILDAVERAEALDNSSDKVETERKKILSEAESQAAFKVSEAEQKAENITKAAKDETASLEEKNSRLKLDNAELEGIKAGFLAQPEIANNWRNNKELIRKSIIEQIDLQFFVLGDMETKTKSMEASYRLDKAITFIDFFKNKILLELQKLEEECGEDERRKLATKLSIRARKMFADINTYGKLKSLIPEIYLILGHEFYSRLLEYLSKKDTKIKDTMEGCDSLISQYKSEINFFRANEEKIEGIRNEIDNLGSSEIKGAKKKLWQVRSDLMAEITTEHIMYDRRVMQIKGIYNSTIDKFSKVN